MHRARRQSSVGNTHLAEAIAASFGQEETSDCVVIFCREAEPTAAKRQRGDAAADATDGRPQLEGEVVFGAPLPAHSLILRFASTRFAAQAEAQAARLALRFAYTGQLELSSIRQALETVRVADYLEIRGCGAACVRHVTLQLHRGVADAGRGPGVARGPASRGAATAASGSAAAPGPEAEAEAEPAVLQLYSCSQLWPDPASEPGFAAALSYAKPALVRHFGDALAALNRQPLRRQLLRLPAAGLEALLESDLFATDSEDSVLTLLATWTAANWARTDAAARRRLAGLVRLCQLSRSASACLLAPLAVDHEVLDEHHVAGWLPVTCGQASILSTYATALPGQQADIRRALPCPAWHNARARRPCLPRTGRTYDWTMSRARLQEALAGGGPLGREVSVFATFGAGREAAGEAAGEEAVVARGFAWRVKLSYKLGEDRAGLYLCPYVPAAYLVEGSRLGPEGSFQGLRFPVGLRARLSVGRWRHGRREDACVSTFDRVDSLSLNTGLGVTGAIRLMPATGGRVGAGGGGGTGAAGEGEGAAGAGALAAWSAYLHGGRISGSLTVLPEEGDAEEGAGVGESGEESEEEEDEEGEGRRGADEWEDIDVDGVIAELRGGQGSEDEEDDGDEEESDGSSGWDDED